jgi:NAD(P)-dependent dehydrogenase (short-subunit alcohol dehydrogenase family)
VYLEIIFVTTGDLIGQVGVVTGSASGIGRNIAVTLAQAGAHVVIADYDSATGQATADELEASGLKASFVHADLSTPDGPKLLIDECVSSLGNIDILVHNARSGTRRGLLDETHASWTETLAVTLNASFFGSQAAIEHWRTTNQKLGRIVLVGSVAGRLVTGESPAYHVAKSAVEHLTKYLAVAGGEYGVRVNGVSPGFIVKDEHQPRFDQEDNEEYRLAAGRVHPMSSVGTANDVAEAVLFLVSGKTTYVSGHMLNIDGGSSVQEQWLVATRETGL